jgi:APA family basic amino acid/polyamine antiporter
VISGTGVIVGAGIYAFIGEAARFAGGATGLAFLGAAVVAALTGLSCARMAGRIPRNSPEFQFVNEGLGPRAGVVAGWLMISATLVATAAVALGFAGYAGALISLPRPLIAMLLVLVLGALVWRGIQESSCWSVSSR